jgi:hypothetical protein
MQLYRVDKYGARFTYLNENACPPLDLVNTIVPAGAHCPHLVGMTRYIGYTAVNAHTDATNGTCPAPSDTLDASTVDTGCVRTIRA